ncbi:L-seryl-tRNA(Sec) selenium transferase [Allorhizocola rhizosphaerae]|uniref:L-seryl-tRNA(Sec) selenium transferase n=1 Tax=Allorhizocola rhizosphaerae TaxID=1872709 RepID=UPI000E3E4F78|nr:L-seryl-tRNA(Sec) selenium transferase [Allorhizocola rhizosphaerae]
MDDPRRAIPRVNSILDDPRFAEPQGRLGRALVRAHVGAVLQRVRGGELPVDKALETALDTLPKTAASLRRVINATGVIVHTNLGRAPLSEAAKAAMVEAAGHTDVEFDLTTGQRAARGTAALAALAERVPEAEAVHVVNNNAAALVLVALALAPGREILISRGEFIEIGAGFRIPDLLAAAGARIREVGMTNRTRTEDYADAITPETALILKLHPSNYFIKGFFEGVPVEPLAKLNVPVVYDIGSGLLEPHPLLPDEPDARSALRAGAALVTASGDKLLGGPQAGIVLGRAELVAKLRKHPLARAMRVDKTTLAALEATLRGPLPPVHACLEADVRGRAAQLAKRLHDHGIDAHAVQTLAAVGGGGAPDVELPSWAVSLPARYAEPLRGGDPPVVGRVAGDRCLLDLRAVQSKEDDEIFTRVSELA